MNAWVHGFMKELGMNSENESSSVMSNSLQTREL